MPPMCNATHEEPQEKRKECHPCSHKTPSTLTTPKAALHTYMKILNHTLMHPSYNKSLTLTIAIQHKASRRRQALKGLNAKTQEWIPTRARGNEDSSHHAFNM